MLKTQDTVRQQVFSDIRRSLSQLGPSAKAAAEKSYEQTKSSEAPRPVVDGILVDKFIEKHIAVNGTFKIVRKFAEVPDAVGEYLAQHDLPCEMVMGNSQFLSSFDWPHNWQISIRTARKADLVSVTDALCMIAETGTIVIASSPQSSSTHPFLPENHVVIVNIGQVVRHLEDALNITSPRAKGTTRGIHMITGPSKTADVEQTIQYGAHGPRRLHVIIIDAG